MKEITKNEFNKFIKNKIVHIQVDTNKISYIKNKKIIAICETTEIDGMQMSRFLRKPNMFFNIKKWLKSII